LKNKTDCLKFLQLQFLVFKFQNFIFLSKTELLANFTKELQRVL